MKKLFCLVVIMSTVINAQDADQQRRSGIRRSGVKAGTYTTAEVMARAKNRESFYDETLARSCSKKKKHNEIGLNFLGARIEQTNYALPSGPIPPDTMGAVGPTQFIVAINGRIRSFNKRTGRPDLILDATTNDFFEVERDGRNTSDIRIRYDRFSERWFI